MVSAGDHERLPDPEEKASNQYVPTEEELSDEKLQGQIHRLRKGVKIGKKSSVAERISNMSIQEYEQYLKQHSIKPTKETSNPTHIQHPSHPSSPVRGRTNRLRNTLPERKPENVSSDHGDLNKIIGMAMQGKSGFNITNSAKRKLIKGK